MRVAKYDVFISYRRDGGEHTAKILRDHLSRLGYHVFFDVESLRSGDFNTKLYSVIDECTDVLIVLSAGALDRCVHEDDWVRREVEYALAKEKNVVPVMLRGFVFPETLPDSIEPLRYKNGLEANTQFFDAFIQSLSDKFLQSKPDIRIRLFRRKRLLFASVLLALLLVAGGIYGFKHWRSFYPQTAAEKNLTKEIIYYTEKNLSSLDAMAGYTDDALQAGKRYLSSGEADRSILENKLEVSRTLLQNYDISAGEPSADMIARISQADAPFGVDEILAQYECVKLSKDECIDYVDQIERILCTDETAFLSVSEKLEVLECYETIQEESLASYAYNANELLLPIRDEALETFWNEYLPMLTHLPLNAAQWSKDANQLEGLIDESTLRIDGAVKDMAVLLGNAYVNIFSTDDDIENASDSESGQTVTMREVITGEAEELKIRIATAKRAGADDTELKKRLLWWEKLQEQYEDKEEEAVGNIVDSFGPEQEDEPEILWFKIRPLLCYHYDEEAMKCVELLEEKAKDTDPYAGEYVPALRRFIGNIPQTGIRFGVMVVGWEYPDMPNDVLHIGDVIVAFNGRECHLYDEYAEWKSQLKDTHYEVSVLRQNESGELEQITLELTTDMPKAILNTVSDSLQHIWEEEWQ